MCRGFSYRLSSAADSLKRENPHRLRHRFSIYLVPLSYLVFNAMSTVFSKILKSFTLLHFHSFALFAAQKDEEIDEAQGDLYERGARRGKTDAEKRYGRDAAHEERNRDTHAERADDALNHDERRFAAAVEIARHTEQERDEHTVDGVGLEVFRRSRDDGGVI